MANSNQLNNRVATAAPGMGGSLKVFRATIPLVAGDLTLNVTAKTYRYLDEEEQAPAQPAGGK